MSSSMYDVASSERPVGSMPQCCLRRRAATVAVFEHETFPRFSHGESLLVSMKAFYSPVAAREIFARIHEKFRAKSFSRLLVFA